ncbi:disks large homolog 1-like isoform X2 [Dysidea avara]|uniref:disks large homolog 1-like isoform X2 n=1 Tax=Dysidea avara TaxID=196820 RepID=UPI003324B844
MPTQLRKQDAHMALELLERYRNKLNDPADQSLRDSITRAINAIRSRLFQALIDIQDFYVHTLGDEYKPTYQKAAETLQLAGEWEGTKSPIPVASPKQTTDEEPAAMMEKAGPVAVHVEVPDTSYKHQSEDNTDQDEEKYLVETVVLEKGSTGLGFSIAGGTDSPHVINSTAIYVTKVIPGGIAEQDGRLQLDDEILTVNNVSLGLVTHMQAVQALKDAGQHVTLMVRRPKSPDSAPPLMKVANAYSASPEPVIVQQPQAVADVPPPVTQRILTCQLTKNEKGLGFSIAGGRGTEHIPGDDGIFVTKIIPGGAASEEGSLAIGDRIVKVNNHSMVGITHVEAVDILRSTSVNVELHFERDPQTNRTVGSTAGPTVFKFDGIQPASSENRVEILPYQERLVTFQRPQGTGLGFNIIGGEDNVGIFISFITVGGVADTTGLVKAGDQILEVNKVNLHTATHEDAAHALKNAGTTVELLVEFRPTEFADFQAKIDSVRDVMAQSPVSPGIKTTAKKSLYVRALFDYDHTKDSGLPQPGLSFKHGDVLHVINAGDDDWWQAALVGSHAEDGPKGLIPSKKRVEKKSKTVQKNVKFTRGAEGDKARNSFSGAGGKRKGSLRLSKKLPFFKVKEGSPDEDKEGVVDDSHIPSYEPVMLEHRGYARPVIILGPLKDDINDMLVQEFPDKFAGCVPHTTRKPREGEIGGRDYHFVDSVEQMEKDIQAHLFIEAGRYKDNLYGTSIKAVQEVADQGKHCILGVSGYAIRRLQMAELYPIAICVRPSNAEVIRASNTRMSVSLDHAQQMIEKGEKIEQEFAEYFTAVVDGDSLQDIYSKVKNVIHEQSGNHMWVPSSENI